MAGPPTDNRQWALHTADPSRGADGLRAELQKAKAERLRTNTPVAQKPGPNGTTSTVVDDAALEAIESEMEVAIGAACAFAQSRGAGVFLASCFGGVSANAKEKGIVARITINVDEIAVQQEAEAAPKSRK